MQVTVAQAKADADRSRRDFANLKRTQEQEIQERLENELVMLQRELTMAKPKAATDISRAQVTLHCSVRHDITVTTVSAFYL